MSMSYNYVPELRGRLERIWRPCCMLYVWMDGVGVGGDVNVNISISRLQLMVDSKQRERGGLVGPHQRTLVNFLWSGLHTATD